MLRRFVPGRSLVLLVGVLAVVVATAVGAGAATGGATVYTPGTPTVDGILNGPWNTSQGDGSDPLVPEANLFPTYTPPSASSEPNLALYGGTLGNAGVTPTAGDTLPSGVAGAPGPLDGYCTPGYPSNGGSTMAAEPPNVDLPMAPYYFPDIVRNADGSLTGYFDWRPKDGDEAIVVAKSTDGGKTWTTEGEALDQNGSYCPTADTNDDGQGHPFVMTVGGKTSLYTLQRPAGDNAGVGLLVHQVDPSAANPVANVPAQEPVGIDPNTFATSSTVVPPSGGVSIPVSTLGSAGSPEDIVAGPYEDVNASSPSASIVTCTGAGGGDLTGCTVAGGSPLTVSSGDDLVQVIATPTKSFTIPQGPPSVTDGSGGLATMNVQNGNSTVSPLTLYMLNVNAPNRIYIDGATVYCAQSNANPTNKIEDCTTTRSGGLTVSAGDAITADPIVPATATTTNGLDAPDGIVGTLPSYPGAPAGSTVVLYTEKVLSYFIEGTTNAKITLPASTIAFTPTVTQNAEPLPTSGSFTIYLGTAVGQPIQAVTCTGVSAGSGGSESLTGCSGGTGTVASGNWIGGPNAATAPYSVLSQIGEGTNGSSKGPEKLFGNNEDLTMLRAAYTTDGVNFTDLGPISGSTSGLGSTDGNYDDVSNPDQTTSPSSTGPTNLAPGSQDTVELRYIGSRGTIIQNPDGSYGMFLSGAWATDGDSDAFNQIFYTSSTDGQHWTTPTVVVSTDYTFSASTAQEGTTNPLGVSAYDSGRAYGPAVVQNPDGTLTMVFSGYRLPKPIANVGDVLGTTGAYTVGSGDPALYRNILTMTLSSATSPKVTTATGVTASSSSSTYGTPVTYTAAISVPSPGTGLPTGTASFSDGASSIAACQNVPLSGGVASCTTTPSAGTNQIQAVYSGDSNYATSTGTLAVPVAKATLTVSAANASRLFGRPNPAFTATITGFVNGDTQKTAVTGSPACTTTAQQQSTGGTYAVTCTAGTLQSTNYTFAFAPGTLTVTYTSVISGTSHGLLDVIKPGESVEIAPGAHVFGLIIVEQGASLDVESASLLADLYLQQPGTVRVCGTTAAGAIAVEDGTGPVVIGDPSNGCAGNKIVGLVDVQGNTDGVTVTGNTIDGSLTVLGNKGAVVDQPNTVHGFKRLQ